MDNQWNAVRLKALRRKARLTQQQAMELSGVHFNTIVYLEHGLRTPQNGTLQKLLNVYAARIRYWKQIAEELKDVKGTVYPETSEWKRSARFPVPSNQKRAFSPAGTISGRP